MKGPIIGIIFTPLVTLAMYFAAVEVQAGAVREFAGKNAAVKNLVYSIGGTLGPTGSLALGAVVTMLMAAWLISVIKNNRRLQNS